MNLLKNRSRLVSFRLTPDELENLRVACLLRGARNVSEFARGAVLELSNPEQQTDAQFHDRFSAIELRLTELQSLAHQHQEILRALARALANRDQTNKETGKDKSRDTNAKADNSKAEGHGA